MSAVTSCSESQCETVVVLLCGAIQETQQMKTYVLNALAAVLLAPPLRRLNRGPAKYAAG